MTEKIRAADVKAALLRAADAISRRGFCQGEYKTGRKICSMSAIAIGGLGPRSAGYDPEVDRNELTLRMMDRFVKANKIPRSATNCNHRAICSWNNEHRRTKEDVIKAFKRAASSIR